MTTGKNTYLWEVKAASYGLIFEKEQAALAQLNKYLAYDKEAFKVGDARIKNGTTSLSKVVNHGAYTEYVTYTIEYQNAKNGLILYHFTRHVDKREENTVPVTAPATEKEEETLPSRATSAEVAVVRILDAINTVTSSEETITATEVIALIELAVVLKSYHEKVLVSEGSNTVSLTIVDACSYFISKVTPLMLNFTENAATIKVLVCDFLTTLETCDFDILTEELEEGFYDVDEEEIEDFIKAIQGESEEFDKASEAQPPRDPLIIDLGASGIELHSLENGVNFDLDNNGFAEKTAWTGCEDGFLALDRNENGNIDNGGELFGDQVILNDGSKSASGFEVLSELDENKDAVIDNEDSVFDNLVIWIDANHNGMSESEELKGLNESGIKSISLEHTEISFVDDETGARVAETANVELDSNGVVTTVEISEFWFPVNSSDTTQGGTVTAGNVPDIMQAIRDDETGKLFELCCEFSVAEDIATKRYYLKQILYYITDASDISSDSRGGNIDARDLKVIEQFMGRDFVGVGGANPNVNAAGILNEIYNNIENHYYNVLNMYSDFGGYLKLVYEYEDDNGDKKIDLTLLYDMIDSKISAGEDMDSLVYNLGVYLKSFDEINDTNYFEEYGNHYALISAHYSGIVELSKSSTTYLGTSNNDLYSGTGNCDFIFGQDGDDTLNGGEGKDVIDGDAGDDMLSGAAGNDILYGDEGDDVFDGGKGDDTCKDSSGDDTYIFAKNYGSDIIIDNTGSNTIHFNNLKSEDILVNGTGEYDVTITLKGTKDTLVIKDFCKNEEPLDYTLEFSDKTVHCTDDDSPFKHIYGGDSDDILKAVLDDSIINAFDGDDTVVGSKGNDVIYGNEGNDSIIAEAGNDNIYGGIGDDLINGADGADVILGGAGQDTLDGGSGNDYIFGGAGDDTYIFGKGAGNDIIEDSEGESSIKLNDELTIQDLDIFKAGNEAVIIVKETGDRLIVSDYGDSVDAYNIVSVDSKISIKDVISDTIPESAYEATETDAIEAENIMYNVGTDDSDAIFAGNTVNLIASGNQYDYIIGGDNIDIIFGDGDTDRILAGIGNDVVYGGEGNDQLFGDDDNDFIAGGSADDYINGAGGDDIIIAGLGDDFIAGGAGDDIYYFNVGEGNDSIMDSEGSNTIIFGDITSDMVTYTCEVSDNTISLMILITDTNESIVIKNYSEDNYRFKFADEVLGRVVIDGFVTSFVIE